ncbi:hypothetical protein D9613_009565 [Agrocybe pediades]|uniref:Uncharacterized protein n=1 Tax=Agrocybe pediades TaxID=84607 RepID=A0A8H4R552_9AGAR|nr:hypothetical protein D9613_009565 [Agrocybe pediades]
MSKNSTTSPFPFSAAMINPAWSGWSEIEVALCPACISLQPLSIRLASASLPSEQAVENSLRNALLTLLLLSLIKANNKRCYDEGARGAMLACELSTLGHETLAPTLIFRIQSKVKSSLPHAREVPKGCADNHEPEIERISKLEMESSTIREDLSGSSDCSNPSDSSKEPICIEPILTLSIYEIQARTRILSDIRVFNRAKSVQNSSGRPSFSIIEYTHTMLAIQIFYSALISLFVLSSGIFATPLPVAKVGLDELVVRAPPPIPSLAEVKAQMNVLPNTSLFYSCNELGEGSCRQAREWARKNKPEYKVLAQMWKNPAYPNPWQTDEATSKAFFDVASQAMAELSAGTVYVILGPWTQPDGKDWYSGSVWARKEWPALLPNTRATPIIRVNAATGATIRIKG